MQLHGTFVVNLNDGIQQYHENGSWRIISKNGVGVVLSEDHKDWESEWVVRSRLYSVEGGDTLEARSASGKTGVAGEIVSRAGNHLIVDGEAWGASHAACASNNRVGFTTDTFQVIAREAYYDGSIQGLKGRKADHDLIRRIQSFVESS